MIPRNTFPVTPGRAHFMEIMEVPAYSPGLRIYPEPDIRLLYSAGDPAHAGFPEVSGEMTTGRLAESRLTCSARGYTFIQTGL